MTHPGNISERHQSAQDTELNELRILVKACIKKERSAQKRLYDEYSPTMYGVIRRYVYDIDTAKGLLNEAFFRILTKIDQYSFQGSFEGWMRQITVNIITDHFRKNKKHQVLADKDIESINIHVDNDIVGRINYKILLELIHQLPETQRAVFNLSIFENYAHKEIATMLDITETNSRWHLNDARRRLKDKIKELM